MTLQLLHSEFPHIWGKFDFFIISAPTEPYTVLLKLGSSWMTGLCLALDILFGLMYIIKPSFSCSIFLKRPWGRGLSGPPEAAPNGMNVPEEGGKGPLSPRFTPTESNYINAPEKAGGRIPPPPRQIPLTERNAPGRERGTVGQWTPPPVWISCHISYAQSPGFYPYLHSLFSSVVDFKMFLRILYVHTYDNAYSF